jgi:hypothetical protein
VKDTKFNRSIFQLQPSVLRIKEKEYGSLLPTPTTQEIEHPNMKLTKTGRRLTKDGKDSHSLNLADTVKMWRTPTTMDSKEDSLKHATKLVQGKNIRSTGSRIQISLADEVMVEQIKQNPELMEKYKDYEMVTRKNLPEQQEFVDYMSEQTTVAALFEKTGIKRTTIEHWFRRDKAGFSHPSVEDWEQIKPHLKTIKYDKEMTTLHSIEWKEDMKIWRTPDAHCNRGPSSEKRMKMKLEKGMPISINDQVAHPNLMWPTPVARDWKGSSGRSYKGLEKDLPTAVKEVEKMWPTPNARDWKDSINKVPPSVGKTRGYTLGMKIAETRQTVPSTKTGGSLNPTWVEWLMGYPAGYTDLKDWAILSSRKSPKKSVKPSLKRKK